MRWRARSAGWPALMAMGGLALSGPAAAATSGIVALAPDALPVAIREGKLAEVRVHAVPFAPGSATLDDPIARALAALVAAAATDCFQFAQVVGHVRPGAAADGETLAAHRLARERAATVRTALRRAGMPESAITTVWDYRFATRASRATLWLFGLRPGGTCARAPLLPAQVAVPGVATAAEPQTGDDIATAAAVAAVGPDPLGSQALASIPGEPRPGGLAPARLATEAGGPAGAETRRAPGPVLPETVTAGPLSYRVSAHPATAAAEATRPVRVELPPPERTGGSGPHDLAASVAPPSLVGDVRAMALAAAAGHGGARVDLAPALARPGTAEPEAGLALSRGEAPFDRSAIGGATPGVEIQFDSDSSYLNPAAIAALRRFAQALPATGSWLVELHATVGDRAGALPPERAAAYNRWLAERRQGRIETWLATRDGTPALELRRSLMPHDETRRVVLRAHPLP